MGLNKKAESASKDQSRGDQEKLFDEIIDYFTRVEKKTINMVNRELMDKSILNQMVVDYLKDKQVSEELTDSIVKMFDAYVFGYHILEPLVNDETISDIKITRYDVIRIKRNGKRAIISKYGLDWQRYDKNTVENGITWESCTLRKWLNGRFINAAFNEREKQLISTVTVPADRNPEYDTNPGNPTEDKVFLLSINEANRYFSSDEPRQCRPTEYAAENGINQLDGGNCQWWLRSPGFEGNCAAIVGDDGGISSGHYVGSGTVAIRPILWIDLDA